MTAATGAILLSTLLDCLDVAERRFGLVVTRGALGIGAAMIVENWSDLFPVYVCSWIIARLEAITMINLLLPI